MRMVKPSLVLIDTCMWVVFFSRKASVHREAIEELLDEDRAAVIGPILSEVLLGFKKDQEADWVASALEGVHFLSLSRRDWVLAARLGRRLAGEGHPLPLTDLVIAACAERHQCAIYSIDPHFDLFPKAKRFP
ncbi:MAG: PIN domain-containing protein [Gemmataceae bacterium]